MVEILSCPVLLSCIGLFLADVGPFTARGIQISLGDLSGERLFALSSLDDDSMSLKQIDKKVEQCYRALDNIENRSLPRVEHPFSPVSSSVQSCSSFQFTMSNEDVKMAREERRRSL